MRHTVNQIRELLPHRYPFLMVDRILSITVENIIAIKNVTHNEPYFQGHWPENPVMPGVLILEALFQTGGLFLGHRDDQDLTYITTVDKVKFRTPVVPGDQLTLKVSLVSTIGMAVRFQGTAQVEQTVVAEATWMSMTTKHDDKGMIIYASEKIS